MKQEPSANTLFSWTAFFGWCLTFALLWALLAGGQGWGFGGIAVVAASAMAVWLKPAVRLPGWRSLPAFLWFFLRSAVHGGWDVAIRAWQPSLPIHPDWVEYEMRSEDARVRLMLSAMVGLLPGTLASHYDGSRLVIHALDSRQEWAATVETLETHLIQLLEGRS